MPAREERARASSRGSGVVWDHQEMSPVLEQEALACWCHRRRCPGERVSELRVLAGVHGRGEQARVVEGARWWLVLPEFFGEARRSSGDVRMNWDSLGDPVG